MSPTATQNITLEEGLDVLKELLLGPEYRLYLQNEHARARVKIDMRAPMFIYVDEIETADGYPMAELIALTVDDQSRDSAAQSLLHEISVQWTVNGDHPETMGRELKRLIAATRNYLKNQTLMPYLGGQIWSGRSDFGPTVTARAQASGLRWIKSASI